MGGTEAFLVWAIEVLIGLVVIILGGTMKVLYNKLNNLESRLVQAVDEPKVRQILEDKLALLASQTLDIKEDIREIKQKLDDIFNQNQKEKRGH